MKTAHRIALDSTDRQRTYLTKAAGTARFAYNWALAEWQRQYQAKKLDHSLPAPSESALRRALNAVKREQFPWMLEVTKCAPQEAIRDLGVAFKNFFEGCALRKAGFKGRVAGYPQFKKKGQHEAFRISSPRTKVEEVSGKRRSYFWIPNLGWVRMREELRFQGKLLSAAVSRVADRWQVSFCVDVQVNPANAENQGEVVGVDLGVRALATLSNGDVEEGPKALRRWSKKLRRLCKSLNRKKEGSANWKKAKNALARLYARIANQRNDVAHKLTSELTKRFGTIVIEDLNVAGMTRNKSLAKSVADASMAEVRRMLEYKTARRGGRLIVADPWFASSKICSSCGHKLDSLPLSVRRWQCPACGVTHDRDLNAAINLKNLAARNAVEACGKESSGAWQKSPRTKLALVKQEENVKVNFG